MKASFLYRIYNGQTEDLYAGPWLHSAKVTIGSNGDFQVIIDGLKKGLQYEFKPVVEYNSH